VLLIYRYGFGGSGASYVLGILLDRFLRDRQRLHFWLVMSKGVVSASIVATVILTTVVGRLNTPICWISWDGTCMELPEGTKDIVQGRLRWLYPIIMFLTFGLLLVAPLAVAWYLRDGMAVYLQRDDGEGRSSEIPVLRRASHALYSALARNDTSTPPASLVGAQRMHPEEVELDDYQENRTF